MTRSLPALKFLLLVSGALIGNLLQAATWIPLNGIQTQASAPEVQLLNCDYNSIKIKVTLCGFSHESISTPSGAFTNLLLEGEGYTTTSGAPALPVIRRFVEIPYGAEVTLETGPIILRQATLAQYGLQRIMPAQPPVAKIPGAEEAAPFVLDQAAYSRPGYVVSDFVRLGAPQYLHGHRFVLMEIFPINYSPAEGRLQFISDIEIQLKFSESNIALTQQLKARYNDRFSRTLAHRLFLNAGAYDQSDLVPLPLGLLIITSPYLAGLPIMQDFVDWKEQKGFHTTVITTAQTGTTNAQIKAYLQNAYDNWLIPPNFVLLIGDIDVIPCWHGQAPDIPGTDLYYATLEGTDLFGDVGLGRLSVGNDTDLVNIINKTLNYEKALWSGDQWEKEAVFMASNDMWQLTEATGNYIIRNYLQPDGYRSTRLYCHTYAATPDQVTANLNAGRSLAMYAGHGYCIFWQDGPRFLQRDVEDLTNDYYPLVGSFACDTGQFMRVPECFGETWIRVPHGAIAFWGAACTSYWGPDDLLEKALFEGFFAEHSPQQDQNLTWIAGMTDYAKFSVWRYFGGNVMSFYYQELYNILGDPTIDVWTDIPQNLLVSIPANVQIGQTNLQVGVSGYPDWAMVNAYSDAEELQFTSYVTNGVVNFNLGAGFTAPGTLHVWVTGHDCRPYHGTAAIIPPSRSNAAKSLMDETVSLLPSNFGISASPNPFNSKTVLSFELRVSSQVNLSIYDISGRLVTTLVNGWRDTGSHQVTFDGSGLPSGIYLARLTAGEYTATQKMVLLK